jgi:hypothetical protein
MRFACFFFLIIIVSACKTTGESEQVASGGKLNGLHKYYYPDGKVYMEVNFKDSIPHGLTRQYFKNGQVFEETNYKNGVMDGVSKKFYEDGKLSMETPYDSGRIHGVQKKFRKDGTPAFEAPYFYNEPCKGLKEFYLSGDVVTTHPKLIVKAEDRLFKDFKYIVRISLSEKAKAEFFKGELTDGKYIGKKAEKLYVEKDGTATVEYYLSPGQFVMEKINIIAKIRTDLGNYLITEQEFRVAAQNR